jgi:hypothetical protein
MFALTHVIRAYEMIKGTKMGITEARQEAWCLMLLTSQREFQPVIKKDYATKTIEGVIVKWRKRTLQQISLITPFIEHWQGFNKFAVITIRGIDPRGNSIPQDIILQLRDL